MAEATPWNPSPVAVARVKNPLPAPTVCEHCGAPVEIVRNGALYGRDYGDWPWSYACTKRCSYVGMHPQTGIPLGTLATKEIREARKAAKAAFNPLWQADEHGQRGPLTRSQAYACAAQGAQVVDFCRRRQQAGRSAADQHNNFCTT